MTNAEHAERKSVSQTVIEHGAKLGLSALREGQRGAVAYYRRHRDETIAELTEEASEAPEEPISAIRKELREFTSTISGGIKTEVGVLKKVKKVDMAKGVMDGVLAGIEMGLVDVVIGKLNRFKQRAAQHTDKGNKAS